jgi:hypothetical protein
MTDDSLGAQLMERGRLYLARELRKVERDVRRDPRSHAGPLVHPMLDVTDRSGGGHVMMLMDLPRRCPRTRPPGRGGVGRRHRLPVDV